MGERSETLSCPELVRPVIGLDTNEKPPMLVGSSRIVVSEGDQASLRFTLAIVARLQPVAA
jgi:hypothetical protein